MVVFKFSEFLLFSVFVFVDILYDVGVLVGVFNLLNGDGFEVGLVFFSYFFVDMVLIIGLICVGILVV